MMPLTLSAPAKLNLFLHVTGQRPDGYHELETLFQFVDLADTLTFGVTTDARIHLTAPMANLPMTQNLVWRAANLLWPLRKSAQQGIRIELTKRIPAGGGLGGGSSDAATTLLALNQLWDLQLSSARLQQLGLQLGADVPVFIHGQATLARGVGEAFSPAAPAEAWYLIVNPGVAVSTADIFRDPDLPRATPPWQQPATAWLDARNDCQELVCKRYPQVAKALNWLLHYGPTRMTGTGASLFTLCSSQQHAEQVLQELPAAWQGVVTQGRNQSPVPGQLAEHGS